MTGAFKLTRGEMTQGRIEISRARPFRELQAWSHDLPRALEQMYSDRDDLCGEIKQAIERLDRWINTLAVVPEFEEAVGIQLCDRRLENIGTLLSYVGILNNKLATMVRVAISDDEQSKALIADPEGVLNLYGLIRELIGRLNYERGN